MAYRQKLGHWGEKVAEVFLHQKGLTTLGNNIHTEYGEIDLVMNDHQTVVFVEVKTRTNMKFGLPEESVTPQKQIHLIQSAERLMQLHPEWGENWRIDILAIYGPPGDTTPEITWFENAVA